MTTTQIGAIVYKGSARDIVQSSILIAKKSIQHENTVLNLIRDELEINPKVFSKLKIIGLKMLEIDKKNRQELVKQLPDSYSTIHCCSLLRKII